MTDKVDANLNLKLKLGAGVVEAENGGFDSIKELRDFLGTAPEKDPLNKALEALHTDHDQVDQDVAHFFGDEIAEEDTSEEVSINITVKGGKVQVNS